MQEEFPFVVYLGCAGFLGESCDAIAAWILTRGGKSWEQDSFRVDHGMKQKFAFVRCRTFETYTRVLQDTWRQTFEDYNGQAHWVTSKRAVGVKEYQLKKQMRMAVIARHSLRVKQYGPDTPSDIKEN